MKQIVDKLNKIAKKIDGSVEIPQTDLIIDSLDAITKAYGGTPNDSHLIVDKLEDIYNNISSGGSDLTSATFTENGTFNAEDFETAGWNEVTVNVSGGSTPRSFAMINAFSLSTPIPLNTPIDISEHMGIIIPTSGGFSATISVNGLSSSRHFTYDENSVSFEADGGGFIIDFNSRELYVTLESAPTALSFNTVNAILTGGITMADGGDNGLIIPNVKNSLQQDNTYSYAIAPHTTAEIVIPAIVSQSGGPK